MKVTDAQIAEWRANPHAGENPAVVPALIAELELLREQRESTVQLVRINAQMFDDTIRVLRAEIEKLRGAVLRPLDTSEIVDALHAGHVERKIAEGDNAWTSLWKRCQEAEAERDGLRAKLCTPAAGVEITKTVVPLTDEQIASARRLCNGIDGDEDDWLKACLTTLPLLLDEIDRLRLYEKTAATESFRLINELNEARKERDMWKRRAAQHGCDVEQGDHECA